MQRSCLSVHLGSQADMLSLLVHEVCFKAEHPFLTIDQAMVLTTIFNPFSIRLFVTLSILLILMPVNYQCVSECTRTFETSSNLSKHKRSCRHATSQREKTRVIRTESWKEPGSFSNEPQTRKQRLQVILFSSRSIKFTNQR